MYLGLLPMSFLTWYSFQIGVALEAVLFSLALADRINILRQEKEREEAAAREAQLRAHAAEFQAQTIEKELQTAHSLQMGLMPTQNPQLAGFDVAGRCLPASHVGGDFFQYFHKDGRFALALADVTGHGMEAAVPVMMFSGILETEMRLGNSLDALFGHLNQTLYHKLDSRTYVCWGH